LCHRLAFELSEVRLALVGEDLRDWFSSACDDDGVDVHEFPCETARDDRPDRAFPVAMNPVRISLGVICVIARIQSRACALVVADLFEEAFEVASNFDQ
jgi:hypothetical protein